MTLNFKAPRYQQFDSNGDPAAGAKLYFYDTGTSTPRAVYSDDGLSSAISQPVVADSAGLFVQIFISTGAYRAVCTNASGSVTFFDEDDIDPSLSTGAGALAVASGGTGSTTEAGALTSLGAYPQTSGDALELRVDDVEAELDLPILAAAEAQTFASSLTPVFTTFETRSVTLTGNVTIGAPTVTVGQTIRLYLIQDATGSRTASWNSAYKFPQGVVGLLSTSANAVDMLEGHVKASGEIQVSTFKRQDQYSSYATGFYTDYDLGAVDDDATVTQAHGLSAYPSSVQVYLQCTSADLGYAVGDRVAITSAGGVANSDLGATVTINTTNVLVTFGTNVHLISRSTFNNAAINEALWNVIIRVFN